MDWIDKLSDKELDIVDGWLDKLQPITNGLNEISEKAARKREAAGSEKEKQMTEEILTTIPSEPDQTKYERDTLIWMLIDITGEPNADLFAEAIAEIKKLKDIREGATHWAGNAVHFQQEANGLRKQLTGKERLIESQRETIRKLRSEEWEARKLLEQIADPEPCRLDHHGYCQEHLWVGKGECAHRRARKLLGYER